MSFQESIEREKAAHDVLARLSTVNPKYGEFVPVVRQIAVVRPRFFRVRHAAHGGGVDRDRVRPYLDAAVLPPHRKGGIVDHSTRHVRLTGVHKRSAMFRGLKTDDVVAEHPFADRSPDFQRKQTPVVGIRPGNMYELLQACVGSPPAASAAATI